jgi:hypothetical protein
MLAYDMPLLIVYTYRDLNLIELQLFRVCRNGKLGCKPIIVPSLYDFRKNLNTGYFIFFVCSYD